MFEYINGATIENVSLQDVNITGGDNTGGLAGYATDGNIDNSFCVGEVSGVNYLGGFVGNLAGTSIVNTYEFGSVTCTNNSNTNIGMYAGNDISSASITASSYRNLAPRNSAPLRSPAPQAEATNTSFQISKNADANSSIDYNKIINLDLTDFDLSDVDSARATLAKIENLSAAKSTLLDTNIAQETANPVKAQILQNTSIAVLTQTRQLNKNMALTLLGSITQTYSKR